MNFQEVNFDGIVGPTHHYGGLSPGNLASQQNRLKISYPRRAALEGLAKMKLLMNLGLKQGLLPPHPRPHFAFLREQGYGGSPREVVDRAGRERPDLLSIAYSSAAMWTANAAMVSPSIDTADGRVHMTPANLLSTTHRALESAETTRILQGIFANPKYFIVYDPLPNDSLLADEGAANQMRLCRTHGSAGIEVFVYGRDADDPQAPAPRKFPARQTRQACERIAVLHDLPHERRVCLHQNPEAIDAGVFHNDVIAVGNENVLLCHARAYLDQQKELDELRRKVPELVIIQVGNDELSLEEAVSTYLFNSQLVTLPKRDEMLLLCPVECETHPRARSVIDRVLGEDNPITGVRYVDVRQSMRNGGGPACLRLRVVLSEAELEHIEGNVLLTEDLHRELAAWVEKNYRETLTIADLADPLLIEEVETALEELAGILHLPTLAV
jgi:succinylarginine dihydrolase